MIMIVGITEVRKNLSKLIDSLSNGNVLVITKNNKPIAELKALTERREKTLKFGLARGLIHISEDFDNEDQIINSLFGMYKDKIKIKDDDDDLFSTGVEWDAQK